jgi:acyl-CoA thioester hydrolase
VHRTEIRVRYEETDRMGVVYYGKYFTWFEVARTEFFRKLGLSYRDMEERDGLGPMVCEASCNYKTPATYDDLLNIETSVTKIKNTSLAFGYKIYRRSDLVATGETWHVFTNKSGRPTKIPENVKRALLL